MLLSSPPLPRVYLGCERRRRLLHRRMLNNDELITQIRSKTLLLYLFLPVPNFFVVHNTQTMESNGTRNSNTFLGVIGMIIALRLS